MFSYTQLRKDYPEFIYHGYQIKEEKERICLEYDFEIPGLSSFHPTWEFPKKDEEKRCIRDRYTISDQSDRMGYRMEGEPIESCLLYTSICV